MSLPIPQKAPPGTAGLARDAWNLMGAQIDWAALPIICEMYGITEIETFVTELAVIRNFKSQ